MTHLRGEHLVEAFVEHAQRDLAVMTAEQLDEGWGRLQHSSEAPRPSPRRAWFRLGMGLATAMAVAAVAIVAYRFVPARPEAPLHYSVEGAASVAGNRITAPPDSASSLRFSDESRIDLAARTTVSLDGLAGDGAQVTLLDGTIDVMVEPRRGTSWTFAAGPFWVEVKGTSFRLGYSQARQRMSLHMTSGLVEVLGPDGRTMAVSAGETLELFADPTHATDLDGETGTRSAPSSDEGPVPPPVPPGATNAQPERASTAAEPSHRRPTTRTREERELPPAPPTAEAWSKLVTQERYADVIAEAQGRGIEATLAQASATDLSALADAARYTKHHDLARRALLAIRARFAGTEPARDASFFLGRLGENLPGQHEVALGWYETYLREAPRGLYAGEALGREMTLLAGKDARRAGRLAKLYLERFPHGPQAELARSLRETGDD